MALRLRRGTNAGRLGITPVEGELIYTTDTKTVYVGDGVTVGGNAVSGGGGGGATDINSLTDVTIISPTNGQVLKYNGTAWVNGTDDTGGGATDINSLTDVTITSPTNGQVLKYNGTAWVNGTDATGGGGSGATYEISAETATGGANLRLTGSDLTTDDVKLAEGTGITITRTDANTITIQSTVVAPEVLADLADTNVATPTLNDVLKWDGISWSSSTLEINDMNNVNLSGQVTGELLKYDGTNWVNANAALSELSDISIIGTPSAGQVLEYNGTNWVNTTPSALVTSVAGSTGAVTLDTSDVSEHPSALYYTDGRVNTRLNTLLGNGTHTGINYNYNAGTDSLSLTVSYPSLDTNAVLDVVGSWLLASTQTGISYTYNSTTNALTSTVNFPTLSSANLSDFDVDAPEVITTGEFLRWNATTDKWENSTLTLPEVVDDLTPQLGGNLNLNNKDITGTGNINIVGDSTIGGQVYIGTSTEGYAGGLFIYNTNQGVYGTQPGIINVENYYNAANGTPFMNFFRGRGTPAVPIGVTLGDFISGFRFIAGGSDPTQLPQPAVVVAAGTDPNGSLKTDNAPGTFGIQIRNNSGTLSNAISYDMNGLMRVAPNTAVAGPSSGDVDTSAVVGYLKIKISSSPTSTVYAIPYYAIRP